MSEDVREDTDIITSFKIMRLRLLRPPPANITLSKATLRGTVSAPITLAVGITDDYGVDFDQFDSLQLRIAVVDTVTRQPIPGIRLSFTDQPRDSSTIEIKGYNGPFHTLKGHMQFTRADVPRHVCVALSLDQQAGQGVEALSDDARGMLAIMGEGDQTPLKGWDDKHYAFMPAFSGNVEILKAAGTQSVQVSSDKVQTIERLITLATLASDSPRPPPIVAVERPGLNNSTGQRLWDCALTMSYWLASQGPRVFSRTDWSNDASERRPQKMARRSADLAVIELGAGSGLVSLTCARLAHMQRSDITILATDVEATVTTTLAENLGANDVKASQRAAIHARELNWGRVAPANLRTLLEFTGADPARANRCRRLVLGADILYNPSSHQLLLETLQDLLRTHEDTGDVALIAYKKRTDGDDGMFATARQGGMNVDNVWEWGDVSIWQFRR